jgi:uncharacterized membrane protein YgcG
MNLTTWIIIGTILALGIVVDFFLFIFDRKGREFYVTLFAIRTIIDILLIILSGGGSGGSSGSSFGGGNSGGGGSSSDW